MTVHNSMGVVGKDQATGAAVPVVTPSNVRALLAAFVRRRLSSFQPRTGRLKGPAGGNLFTYAGSGWTYLVEPGSVVIGSSPTRGGDIVSSDQTITLTTDPSPSSGSRIDIIYAVQKDAFDGANDTTQAIIDLAKGPVAISGSPAAPDLPAGAVELARNVMQSTATSTGSTGNAISNTSPYTGITGGIGYYGSVTEMQNDDSRYRGDVGYNTADNRLYVKQNAGTGAGAVEQQVALLNDIPATAAVNLRQTQNNYASGAIIRDSSERTMMSVTVTVPAGRTGVLRAFTRAYFRFSGSNSAGNIRYRVNGTQVNAHRYHNHGTSGFSWHSSAETGYRLDPGTYTITSTIQNDSSSGDTEVWDALTEFTVEY